MDNTTDRIYFKDRQSRFLLINRSTADFFKLEDPAQAVGKTDYDYFSEKHARQAYTDEQQIIASGESLIGIEEKETWPDGHETWVSSSKIPFRDRDGRIIGIFGISRDITDYKLGEEARIRAAALREANVELEKINASLQTEIGERKRVEELLAHERDLFRAMMDNTTDRIYFKDPDSRFLLINQSLAHHFGINDPSEAIGKRDFDFFSDEHAREAYEDEKTLVASEEPFIGKEEKETWPDGHSTWVSTTKFAMRDLEGKIIGTFGISRDITERKAIEISILQANEELEKSNAALQAEINERRRVKEELDRERELLLQLIENLPDFIFAKDAEGRFTLGNIALAHHMGVNKPEDLYGKGDFDFYPPDLAQQFYADEQALLHSGRALIEHEESTRDSAGRPMWTLTTKVLLHDSQGKVIGLAGNSRDITKRKEIELSLELANAKLAKMVNWLEGRNREINVLNEMGKMLESCRTREEAYLAIAGQMGKLIPVQAGRLFVLGGDPGRLEIASSWGENPGTVKPFPPQDCLGIRHGRMYVVNAAHPGISCAHLPPETVETADYLCIPLIAQGDSIGLLHLRNRRGTGEAETITDSVQQLAITAADHISLALANLTLRENLRIQSIRDALTGLFNRRYLEESLLRELARAKRKAASLGVVMLDVDRLKQVNDSFGHEAGDALLQTIGEWLHASTRAEDIACRYGGDEFMVIMPDATLGSTRQRVEQIRDGIRSLKISHHDQPLGPVTVSIGVAAFPEHGQTRDALLAAVDAALYQAKEQGRDRVVIAGG